MSSFHLQYTLHRKEFIIEKSFINITVKLFIIYNVDFCKDNNNFILFLK